MNGRTIRRERHKIVDERRDQLKRDVDVAMVNVDCGKTIRKVGDLSQRRSTVVLQNEFKVAESLNQRNYLHIIIYISILCQVLSGFWRNNYSNNNLVKWISREL